MTGRQPTNSLFLTKLLGVIKTWTMVESIITGALFVVAICFFFGYAIYSASHRVRF